MSEMNNGFIYYMKLMNAILKEMPTFEVTYLADGKKKTVRTYFHGDRLAFEELVDFSKVKSFEIVEVKKI